MRAKDESEERHVTLWLQRAAEQDAADCRHRSLPSASHLWWKAQIIRRLTERDQLAERAMRPVRWSQWAAVGLGCLLFTFFAAWLAYDLFSELDAQAPQDVASGSGALVGLLVAGTVLPLLAFGVFWSMSRDA